MGDATDDTDAATAEDSTLPKTDPATGVALVGKYPLNYRLRAEALVAAGLADDPDNIITAELIADTKLRLEREAAAEQGAARALHNMNLADLRATALAEGVPIEGDANKATIRNAIEAHRAPTTEG